MKKDFKEEMIKARKFVQSVYHTGDFEAELAEYLKEHNIPANHPAVDLLTWDIIEDIREYVAPWYSVRRATPTISQSFLNRLDKCLRENKFTSCDGCPNMIYDHVRPMECDNCTETEYDMRAILDTIERCFEGKSEGITLLEDYASDSRKIAELHFNIKGKGFSMTITPNTAYDSCKSTEENKIICMQGYEVQVLNNSAGYYIGTITEDGPNCRISQEYYKTKEKAETALKTVFQTRESAMENHFCNGGLGCRFQRYTPTSADESTANHI